jgi:hypothetical protein
MNKQALYQAKKVFEILTDDLIGEFITRKWGGC